VDFEDIQARIFVGVGEFNLAVNTARSQKSVVQDVDTVSCHDDFDVLTGFETIELVKKFQHGALNF
jgi:hypothetical protein